MTVGLSVSVCPLAYLRNRVSKHREIFCTLYPRPWLSPAPTTVQYMSCTSAFVDDVMFSYNGSNTDTGELFTVTC